VWLEAKYKIRSIEDQIKKPNAKTELVYTANITVHNLCMRIVTISEKRPETSKSVLKEYSDLKL
jgi:hypothetical protein